MRVVLVLVCVLFGACGGRSESDLAMKEIRTADLEPPPGASPVASVTPAPSQSPAPQQVAVEPRMVIRNAELQMTVARPESVAVAVTRIVEGRGGYVTEQRQWREAEQVRMHLVLRIPAQRLTEVLGAIRRQAIRVQSENITGQDVTQEYTDLASQLRNLEAAETELRELLRTARERSQRAADIMEVYNQLTNVRGQIEQIKGRMQYLQGMSAFSTIRLDLVPDALARPLASGEWRPLTIAWQAGSALVATLQSVASLAIWLLVYALPFALLVGLPVYGLVRWARRHLPHLPRRTERSPGSEA